MYERLLRACAGAVLVTLLAGAPARAQPAHPAPAPSDTTRPRAPAADPHAGMDMGMDHMGMDHSMHMGPEAGSMRGLYGPYPMRREASGTSWQPDAAHHLGLHVMRGEWMVMLHGFADLVYDDQGGPRGGTKWFGDNMGMAMAQRPLGPGALGLRAMLSLEPATIGKQGYPLLFQTGETADGVTPLIDRQHPHDLFMELAASYSLSSGDRSLFLYGGLPGEPALGPPAFMHRFSGLNLPAAPITHHWLDSSHITYGVLTAGAVVDRVKVEGSAFRGREPDENRWNIEAPKLDSYSFRLSVNPGEHWSLQASYGRLESPEQLEPEVDQQRLTASAMVDGAAGGEGRWEATIAWGEDRNDPGHSLDALLLEGALEWDGRHTAFARAERAEKDELFVAPDPRTGNVFVVYDVTAGYRLDFLRRDHLALGVGGSGTWSAVPADLRDAYGAHPLSALLFLRAALR